MSVEQYEQASNKQRNKLEKIVPQDSEVSAGAFVLYLALSAADDHVVTRTFHGTISHIRVQQEVPPLVEELRRAGASIIAVEDGENSSDNETVVIYKLYKPELDQ